ncbi:hypothetical protein GCM10010470_27880 [Saccharopolyspora taberi]|uniref:Uncharacterized protein n=1 Tax=Saccharopolyspora taberi TaxID=60895 RepID=A0ABN3VD59_9PSEU
MNSRENPIQARKAAALPTTENTAADERGPRVTSPAPTIPDARREAAPTARVVLTRAQFDQLRRDAELGATFREWHRRCLASESSKAISAAENWARIAASPTYAELERRRAQPGPMAGRRMDPDAVARWVATGYSNPQEYAA